MNKTWNSIQRIDGEKHGWGELQNLFIVGQVEENEISRQMDCSIIANPHLTAVV